MSEHVPFRPDLALRMTALVDAGVRSEWDIQRDYFIVSYLGREIFRIPRYEMEDTHDMVALYHWIICRAESLVYIIRLAGKIGLEILGEKIEVQADQGRGVHADSSCAQGSVLRLRPDPSVGAQDHKRGPQGSGRIYCDSRQSSYRTTKAFIKAPQTSPSSD